jgi:predicted site-specific integrase-resolvase
MAKRSYTFAPGWMDYAAVAHYTCYSVRVVKEWYKKGLLTAARVEGGDPRFKRQDIDQFFEKFVEASREDIVSSVLDL